GRAARPSRSAERPVKRSNVSDPGIRFGEVRPSLLRVVDDVMQLLVRLGGVTHDRVPIFALPHAAVGSSTTTDRLRGERFPRMDDFLEDETVAWFNENVNMIVHDNECLEPIPLPMKVREAFRDNLAILRLQFHD